MGFSRQLNLTHSSNISWCWQWCGSSSCSSICAAAPEFPVPWRVQDSSPLAAFKTEIERRVMEQVCLHSYPSCCWPQGQLINFMGISNSWFHFIVAAWKHKFLGEMQKTVWSFGINTCDCHVWLSTATTSLGAAAALLAGCSLISVFCGLSSILFDLVLEGCLLMVSTQKVCSLLESEWWSFNQHHWSTQVLG